MHDEKFELIHVSEQGTTSEPLFYKHIEPAILRWTDAAGSEGKSFVVLDTKQGGIVATDYQPYINTFTVIKSRR